MKRWPSWRSSCLLRSRRSSRAGCRRRSTVALASSRSTSASSWALRGFSLRRLLAVQELLVAAICLLLAAIDDFRVALQGVEVGVAEDLLHEAHVATCDLEQSGRGRVPRHMRGLERPRAQLFTQAADDESRARPCEPASA